MFIDLEVPERKILMRQVINAQGKRELISEAEYQDRLRQAQQEEETEREGMAGSLLTRFILNAPDGEESDGMMGGIVSLPAVFHIVVST